MEQYILVRWPESQELMDLPGFDANCYLADIEDSGAYFVLVEWYKFAKDALKNKVTD